MQRGRLGCAAAQLSSTLWHSSPGLAEAAHSWRVPFSTGADPGSRLASTLRRCDH